MNPVALSVVIVQVVVMGVLGTPIAKSVGSTQTKTLCKTLIEPYIFTSDGFSIVSHIVSQIP